LVKPFLESTGDDAILTVPRIAPLFRRAEEGDESYEEEQEKTRGMLVGINDGLLRRSLLVTKKQ
jgi:hypothetical protein